MYDDTPDCAPGPVTGALMRLWRECHQANSPTLPPNTNVAIMPHQRVIDNHNHFAQVTSPLMRNHKVPLLPINHDDHGPSTDGTMIAIPDQQTLYLTTVHPGMLADTEKTAARKPLPYIHYQNRDTNPMTMLFGAVVMCVERFGRLPGMLFISPLLEPLLDVQTLKMTGKKYDHHLRVCTTDAMDGRIRAIPIFPESLLPDAIAERLRITSASRDMLISRDSVIALCEV